MKLKRLLSGALLATALAAGVALGIGQGNKAEKAVVAEAATQTITDSTIEIRFTRPSNWGDNAIKIHTWNEGGSGSTWPGYLMTWLWNNSYGEGVFSWSPSASEPLYGKIIFNNNNNGKQTGNLDAPSSSKWYYSDGWHDVETYDFYLYDYDNRFNGNVNAHVWRDNGSGGSVWDGDTWPGNAMTRLSSVATNGLIYKFTMNNRYDRVIFSNNGSDQTGTLTPTGNYCYVLANDDTTLAGKNTWWDNINYALAHNFSQNTMLMRSIPTSDESSTAYCASRYSAAETHFNALMASGYGTFVLTQLNNNFADAMTRLAAWARANGKTLDTTNGTLSSIRITPVVQVSVQSSGVVIAIIAVSLVSILAIGGYFFLRRKEDR